MDAYAITNPKRALKRREVEAGAESAADGASDGDGGTAAKKPTPKPAAESAPPVRFTTGPERLTPEEQARRVEQFRKLQRRQQGKAPAEVI